MMVAVFTAMVLALLVGRLGRSRLAIALLVVCLGLSVGLFLFEVYNPDYGFRMPWIRTELDAPSWPSVLGGA